GILGGRCFLRGGLGVTLRSAGGFTTLLLFLSMLLALHLPGVPTIGSGWVQEGLAGGRIGGALSGLLVMYFAPAGAHIVLIAGLLVSVLIAMPVSLVAFGQRWAEMTVTLRGSACGRSWTRPGTCCRTRQCCCAIRRRGWIGSPTRRSVRRRRCSPRPWRISGSTAR